jgi:hypothetical protein
MRRFLTPAVSSLLMLGSALWSASLAAQAPSPFRGRVEGLVYDSVGRTPLRGAIVQLMTSDYATSRAVVADQRGRFRADSLEPGSWLVAALHPRLDSLGIRQFARGIEVKARGTSRVTLTVPTARKLVAQTCGAAVAADSSGYVHGTVRAIGDDWRGFRARGTAAARTVVRLRWQEVSLGADGVERQGAGIEADVDSLGRFVACGVPANSRLAVRAWRGADSTGVLEMIVPGEGIAAMDLVIGRAEHVTMATLPSEPSDSGAGPTVTVLRGNGALEGVARTANGQPIANALISVWSTGQEVRTDSAGRFAMQALPFGSFTLEARAIGFEAERQSIVLLPDSTTWATVLFESLVVLDTIRVRALRTAVLGRDFTEFETRRKMLGSGHFYGPEDLDRRNLMRMTDLFRATPGMRVTSAGTMGDQLFMRGFGLLQWCRPVVFVDRVRFEREARLENIVQPADVRAVEIYLSPVSVPQEFSQGVTGCGVIVIWTGPRTRLP